MDKKVFCVLLVAFLAVAACKSGANSEDADEQTVVAKNDSTEIVVDSVVSVELADSLDNTNDEPYEKRIVDTVIGGVKFRDYYFNIHKEELSDRTHLVLPAEAANKNIISRLLDDFSLDIDSLQQQLEARFDGYANGSYAEEGDLYFESELVVCPTNILGNKYVAYMIHSSLFWPGEQNHPQWGDAYYMFDLNTSEAILQDDIFDSSEESRQAVGVKIYEELVALVGNAEDIFAEAGSDLLNGSFVFDDKGLTFFYQPYEVGPYMLGEPEVFLTKEWLKPYLKNDGPAYRYWFGE